MADDVDARDGQHDAILGGDGVGMRLGVVVDAAREGIQVRAEGRVLRVVPGLGALGDAVQLHPAVEREMVGTPVFGGAAARFAVEPQQQVGLRLSLRPAVGVEHRLAVRGEDVRDAVAVPEDFGLGCGGGGAGCQEQGEERGAHRCSESIAAAGGLEGGLAEPSGAAGLAK